MGCPCLVLISAGAKSDNGGDWSALIWSATWMCNWSPDKCGSAVALTHAGTHTCAHIRGDFLSHSRVRALLSIPLNPSECIRRRTKNGYLEWCWLVNYTTASMKGWGRSAGSHEYNASLCFSHYFSWIVRTRRRIKERHEPFGQPLGGSRAIYEVCVVVT